jgi:MoaA/NifB/PqqE/SkfB family radical SAM enzyme
MVKLKEITSRIIKGCNRTAIFALTSRCNCQCQMCNMHKMKPETISFQDAKKVLRFLSKNKFLVAYFTGGEPTLHPQIVEIVKFADREGLVTSLTTNGNTSRAIIRDLKEAGLHVLSVSLDHWNSDVCSTIRGREGIMEKQEDIISYAKEIGLKIYALTYLNEPLVRDGVDRLIRHITMDLGVPFGFCYPTVTEVNTYRLNGGFEGYDKEKQLETNLETILTYKKKGYEIMNPGLYIEDTLRVSREQTPNFYCKAGEVVVYIDWKGDVYPCFLKKKLFNILDDGEKHFPSNVKCNECLINCFREPSLLPQLFKSPRLFIKELSYSYQNRSTFM